MTFGKNGDVSTFQKRCICLPLIPRECVGFRIDNSMSRNAKNEIAIPL